MLTLGKFRELTKNLPDDIEIVQTTDFNMDEFNSYQIEIWPANSTNEPVLIQGFPDRFSRKTLVCIRPKEYQNDYGA